MPDEGPRAPPPPPSDEVAAVRRAFEILGRLVLVVVGSTALAMSCCRTRVLAASCGRCATASRPL